MGSGASRAPATAAVENEKDLQETIRKQAEDFRSKLIFEVKSHRESALEKLRNIVGDGIPEVDSMQDWQESHRGSQASMAPVPTIGTIGSHCSATGSSNNLDPEVGHRMSSGSTSHPHEVTISRAASACSASLPHSGHSQPNISTSSSLNQLPKASISSSKLSFVGSEAGGIHREMSGQWRSEMRGSEYGDPVEAEGSEKPLRRTSYLLDSVMREDPATRQMVGIHEALQVHLPGKVGAEDDTVEIKADPAIMRTRRLHAKYDTRMKIVRRTLRNLEGKASDSRRSSLGDDDDQDGTPITEEDKPSVLKVLQQHFLFASLQGQEIDMLLGTILVVEKQQGEVIVNTGDRGDTCYIIKSGVCQIVIKDTSVCELSAGKTFGELAMLYDTPRTATVVCASPKAVLCCIRGPSYRRAMARAKERTLNETVGFLSRHETFALLTGSEKMVLANAFVPQNFEPGAILIREDLSDRADWMYLVQEGKVEVTDRHKNRIVVGEGHTISGGSMQYGQKVVSAKALSQVKCLAIGHKVITRLFGHIGEVLQNCTIRKCLESAPFFNKLTSKQQMALASLFKDECFGRGEVIVTASADPQLVIVTDGEIAITQGSSMMNVMAKGQGSKLRSSPKTTRVKAMGNQGNHVDEDATGTAAEAADENSTPTSPSAPGRAKDQGQEFSGVVPGVPKVEQAPSAASEPELEVPHSASMRKGKERQEALELLILRPGEVFGADTFKEHGCMDHTLVARTDVVASRVGYDEVCQALRGCAERTPSLEWIITKNEVKHLLQKSFPFESMIEHTLDKVIEGFEWHDYAPNECIASKGEKDDRFFISMGGEAVQHCDGQAPVPLTKFSFFGVPQMLLHYSWEVDIAATAMGCAVIRLTREKFVAAVGVMIGDLQAKTRNRMINLTFNDILYLEVLGEGQFGKVRKIHVRCCIGDERMQEQELALKRISKRRVLELDQQSSCALEREILSEVCHPSIVRLIKTLQDEAYVYLIMECLAGGDLFSAIRDLGTLSEEQVLFFSASMVLPIDYLHSRGFIYRDLKPENVMLDHHGFVKLVDFGCCTRKTRSYTFVGTPEYLAPEVILGTGYGKAVDWWGVGVIMYEMIVGPLPFGTGEENDPMETFREVLEKPLTIPRWVPDVAADLLRSMLERMPELRLGSSTMHWQNEVKEHSFFAGMNWDAIMEHSTKPPYQPPRVGGSDTFLMGSKSASDRTSGFITPSHSGKPLSQSHSSRGGSRSPLPGLSASRTQLVPPQLGTSPRHTIEGGGHGGELTGIDQLQAEDDDRPWGQVPAEDDDHGCRPPSPGANVSCFVGF